jgi:hypothetical protein
MPNWCYCELTITGLTQELIRFRDGIRRSEILGSYYPIPQALEGISKGFRRLEDGRYIELWRQGHKDAGDALPRVLEVCAKEQRCLLRRFGATNAYDWCAAWWGSKTGDRRTQLCRDLTEAGQEDFLIYRFCAAWNCPCPGLREVSRQFPGLTFSIDYHEEEACFRGCYVCRNGEELEDSVTDTFEIPEED